MLAQTLQQYPFPNSIEWPWYAIRVRSNFEHVTADALKIRRLHNFSPTYRVRKRWSDRVKELDLPLFPGYVFCRFDIQDRLPVLSAPGVVGIVNFGKMFPTVDEMEIEAVHRVLQSGMGCEPWNDLKAGSPMRIHYGPLTGLTGNVVQVKTGYRLVVSVTLLQRSISVEIDRDWAKPL